MIRWRDRRGPGAAAPRDTPEPRPVARPAGGGRGAAGARARAGRGRARVQAAPTAGVDLLRPLPGGAGSGGLPVFLAGPADGMTPDALEPNDRFEQAVAVNVGAVYRQLNFVPAPGTAADGDFYMFRAKPGDCYLVQTGDLAPGLDTTILLWRAAPTREGRRLLAQNDDSRPAQRGSRQRGALVQRHGYAGGRGSPQLRLGSAHRPARQDVLVGRADRPAHAGPNADAAAPGAPGRERRPRPGRGPRAGARGRAGARPPRAHAAPGAPAAHPAGHGPAAGAGQPDRPRRHGDRDARDRVGRCGGLCGRRRRARPGAGRRHRRLAGAAHRPADQRPAADRDHRRQRGVALAGGFIGLMPFPGAGPGASAPAT